MRIIDQVDGVMVVARQVARGRRLNSDESDDTLVEYTGITQLFMADGTEKFACDDDDAVFTTLRSVVSHRASHRTHRAPRTDKRRPRTSARTIKAVLRVVKSFGDDHGRYTKAAHELNRIGVRTYGGHAWTPGAVRSIFITYDAVFRVRVPRRKIELSSGDVSATTKTPAKVTVTGHHERDHENLMDPRDLKLSLTDAAATTTTITTTTHVDNHDDSTTSDVNVSTMTLAELAEYVARISTSLSITENALRSRADHVGVLCDIMGHVTDRLTKLASASHKIDPIIDEKARLYDEIRNMLS